MDDKREEDGGGGGSRICAWKGRPGSLWSRHEVKESGSDAHPHGDGVGQGMDDQERDDPVHHTEDEQVRRAAIEPAGEGPGAEGREGEERVRQVEQGEHSACGQERSAAMPGEKLAESTVVDAEQAVLLHEAPHDAVPQGAGPEGEGRKVKTAEQGPGGGEQEPDRDRRHQGVAGRGTEGVDPNPEIGRALPRPKMRGEADAEIKNDADGEVTLEGALPAPD